VSANPAAAPIPLQIPPHSIDAEQAVLGGLLIDNGAFDKIGDVVTEGDFYRDDHRRIFRHISRLIEKSKPADVVTVDEAIRTSEDKDKAGGMTYLAALAGNTPSAHNVRRYAEIVHENAERRAIQAAAMSLHDRAGRGDLEDAATELAERVAAIRPKGAQWRVLDLEALSKLDPERPNFLIPDWMPAGYSCLIAGHGGAGKSAIALFLAVCMAAGILFFGLEVARRRVMFLSCEDRESVLHWRLARICSFLGVTLADLSGWLVIVDMVGKDSVLWQRDPRGGGTLTPAYEMLKRRMKAEGIEALFVDGISDTFAGNENDRGDVKRYNNALLALIPADGGLLLVGHVNRATAGNSSTGEGYSGSTGWNNVPRARWYLRPEMSQGDGEEQPTKTGRLVLDLQKSNLGRADQSMRFAWDEDAHLFLGELVESSRFDRQHQDRTEQAAIRRAMKESAAYVPGAMTGPRTAYHVLAQRPEFPASLRGAGRAETRRFWRHVETLRAMRHIDESSIARADRHQVRTLVLTDEGLRACGE